MYKKKYKIKGEEKRLYNKVLKYFYYKIYFLRKKIQRKKPKSCKKKIFNDGKTDIQMCIDNYLNCVGERRKTKVF